jgi:hypothetical protein
MPPPEVKTSAVAVLPQNPAQQEFGMGIADYITYENAPSPEDQDALDAYLPDMLRIGLDGAGEIDLGKVWKDSGVTEWVSLCEFLQGFWG